MCEFFPCFWFLKQVPKLPFVTFFFAIKRKKSVLWKLKECKINLIFPAHFTPLNINSLCPIHACIYTYVYMHVCSITFQTLLDAGSSNYVVGNIRLVSAVPTIGILLLFSPFFGYLSHAKINIVNAFKKEIMTSKYCQKLTENWKDDLY